MSSLGSTTAATPASSSPIRYEAQPRSSWVNWRKIMPPHHLARHNATVPLLSDAEAVLRANWTGASTVPSRHQYPHQWGWDAAFIAFGWARIDRGRAAQELESILSGQWEDGRVPHIVFNPGVADDAY